MTLVKIGTSSIVHPGPPPQIKARGCDHYRLRFVWRIFQGKNQNRRYDFQCVECGEFGRKTHDGSLFAQWVSDRNCWLYFEMPACEAVPADFEFQIARRKFQRSQVNQSWWNWYNAYLRSPAWGGKRQEVLERDKERCRRCFAPATQVHHLTYQNVGYENLEELISLCDRCHEWIHGS